MNKLGKTIVSESPVLVPPFLEFLTIVPSIGSHSVYIVETVVRFVKPGALITFDTPL